MWNEVGPNPIPLTEIEAYLRLSCIDEPFTRLKFVRLIRSLDSVAMKFINEKRSKALK